MTASAGDGKDQGGSTTTDTGGGGTTFYSRVTYTHRGDGNGGSFQWIVSSDANWTPPVCWYESMTPADFQAEIERRYYTAGNDGADSVYDYYYQVQSKLNEVKYHQGDDGSWWVLVWDEKVLNRPHAPMCPYDQGWLWQGPGDPPPPQPVSPALLAQAAYGQMTLPPREVALSPVAQNQKVNLPTYVSFDDGIPQASVTAQVGPVAATVMAVPYSLRVEAGTSYAQPGSCDYAFTPSGRRYVVDSADEPCNVTYQKATSPGGTYLLQARITWRVTWTPTATPQPGGRAMNDGFSDSRQAVSVQEIQTVNR
ncbi:hypothetical protein [Actinacidiphila sp. ITFR-21]|uniref:hypothetical protein n=1 Tax=Actinacidiphila sp. ITFR-21 TaxID=3075199 RepID=UPI002889CA35|nr:hypothetical protein [Streptomyces sp. ITFR-21]WNI16986.1 hypothetical protein RLT57_16630 [Streptomyces sp. ITFR-21]